MNNEVSTNGSTYIEKSCVNKYTHMNAGNRNEMDLHFYIVRNIVRSNVNSKMFIFALKNTKCPSPTHRFRLNKAGMMGKLCIYCVCEVGALHIYSDY